MITSCGIEPTIQNSDPLGVTAKDVSLWPNSFIPFVIKQNTPPDIRSNILQAAAHISQVTNVTLKHYSLAKIKEMRKRLPSGHKLPHALVKYNPHHHLCSAPVGIEPKKQSGYLHLGGKGGLKCDTSSIVHEFLHLLGLHHTQLHPHFQKMVNRDKISTQYEYAWIKSNTIALTKPDPDSIMMYNSWGFSLCAFPTDKKWKTLPTHKLPNAFCKAQKDNNYNWMKGTKDRNGNLIWKNVHGKMINCLEECAVLKKPDGSFFEYKKNKRLSKLDIESVNKLYPTKADPASIRMLEGN